MSLPVRATVALYELKRWDVGMAVRIVKGGGGSFSGHLFYDIYDSQPQFDPAVGPSINS